MVSSSIMSSDGTMMQPMPSLRSDRAVNHPLHSGSTQALYLARGGHPSVPARAFPGQG
jgi:hypothetical protein